MPDQDQNRVNFDRNHIKSTITKLSFKEARRLNGPIYDVLLHELYEESCMVTAKHFKCLVAKEDRLVQQRFTGSYVRDEREFLITLFENFRLAELSYRLKNAGGQLAALKILYHTLILCERYRNKYQWLVTDIHDIVINITKRFSDDEVCFNEIKMRIYYKYGTYIDTTGEHLERAILYLDKAFELTKGELWPPDISPEKENYQTMYEAIPQKLATVLLTHAQRVLKVDPEKALELATFAVGTLSAVSWKDNKYLACKAALTRVRFEIECKKFEIALSDTIKIQPHLVIETKRTEFFPMRCEVFWYKGFCFYSLNQEKAAIESLRIAYELAFRYKIRNLQAEILLTVGRTYGKNPKHINKALEAYTSARRIFASLNDHENKMKTTYLMAKLKADQLLPLFLILIQTSDYCNYYSLRRWKNQVKPFWRLETERKSGDESVRSRTGNRFLELSVSHATAYIAKIGDQVFGRSKPLQVVEKVELEEEIEEVESEEVEEEEEEEEVEEDDEDDDSMEEHFFDTVDNFPRFHWDEKQQIELLNQTRDLDCLLKEFESEEIEK